MRRTSGIVAGLVMIVVALAVLTRPGADDGEAPDVSGAALLAPDTLAGPSVGATVPPPTTLAEPAPASFCDTATWPADRLPSPDRATVVDTDLVLDCDMTVGALRIEAAGSLTFVGDAELTVDATAGGEATGRLEVLGTLTMRPSRDELHMVSFAGLDAGEMVGGDDGMMTDPGGLHAMGPGRLDLDGVDRTAWTRLAAAARQGDRTIVVEETAGWEVGDRITVAPSLPPGDVDFATAYSDAVIVEVADAVVTLDRPLAHDAPEIVGRGGEIHRAEVLNLTRNVVVRTVRGDPAYVTVHPTASAQQLADVALIGLGPEGVVGRYPIHLHRMGDRSRGSTFDRLLVLDSDNRGTVAHGSHGTTWTDVVAHDIRGDAHWWDPGIDENASDDTTWHCVVASRVQPDEDSRFRLAGFELGSGEGNSMTDSVAVGVLGSKDSAGISWPEGAAGRGSGEWHFEGNVSHNNARHGVFTWQNTGGVHEISDLAAWHNGGFGVSHGAYRNGYLWDELDLFDNAAGGLLLHAVSRDPDLRFSDLWIRGGEVGISTTSHQLEAGGPTVFDGLVIEGADTPIVGAATINPDSIDVHDYDGPPVVFADIAHRRSEWRFHRAGGTVEVVRP
ncbi:MAG: hypothetical protein AAGA17_02315 [Actinomycetota bacterium]